jgi:hypothetical protein
MATARAEPRDVLGHAFRLVLRLGVIYHHVDAVERQRPADALSQSPAAAGNDCCTTFKFHCGIHIVLFCSNDIRYDAQ